MKTLAQKVTECREAKSWSQSELARRISERRHKLGKPPVKQQSINQLELGGVDNPRYLLELADVLEVNPAWLTGGADNANPAQRTASRPVRRRADGARNDIFRVPLISWVHAGGLADAADPYLPGDAEDWIPVTHRHGQLIALRVKGASMDKVAPDGSIVVVDLSDRMLVDGRHYIFRHEGRATFKTYRKGPPERLEPQSTDPDYGPIIPEDGVEVVGRVIQKTEEI